MRNTRNADCHPDKQHVAKGLCQSCYDKLCYYERGVKERRKKYYKTNKEKINARRRELEQHPERKLRIKREHRRWYDRHTEKAKLNARIYHLRKRHGITLEKYNELLIKQDGKCAICKQKPKHKYKQQEYLCVDHCHTIGKIRGLLCQRCNKALGSLGDSAQTLKIVYDYLLAFENNHLTTK